MGPWLYIALGLVLSILIILLIDSYRRRTKKTKRIEQEWKTEATSVETEGFGLSKTEKTLVGFQEKRKKIVASVVHEIGAREDQQDSYGMQDMDAPGDEAEGILAIVADGMGGLSNGKAVSSLVVKTCQEVFLSQQRYHDNLLEPREMPDVLLAMARETVYQTGQAFSEGERSGSTLVSAIIRDGYLSFLCIGDSRIYLYRKGGLIQLTREHIYQEELALEAVNGRIGVEQAKKDSQAKALTSYLGQGNIFWLDRNREEIKLVIGDRILLATDGVFGTLSAAQLEYALELPVEQAAAEIREGVRRAGLPYQDNYTAIILEYQG